MVLGQIEALVMVNKHLKFHKICSNTYKVIAKVKVCHDDDNDDDKDYAAANDDDDTRVMTIPRLFFSLKNSRAKNVLCMKMIPRLQVNNNMIIKIICMPTCTYP